jgi:hypothetical protein
MEYPTPVVRLFEPTGHSALEALSDYSDPT